jgi:hypothetical protein
MLEENILDRLFSLVYSLPHVRESVSQQVKQVQQKQKRQYDKKITRTQSYKIGDKVLMYHAAKEKQWSGKLDPKWKGPYYIHQILQNGAYKLKELTGQVLSTPVNAKLLKIYRERDWDPVVLIDNQ